MNTDKILYDILCHLYPHVSYDGQLLAWTAVFGVLTVFAVIVLVFMHLNREENDFLWSLVFTMGVVFFFSFLAFFSALKDDKTDRLIQELIKDPAALKVVQETRCRLEWLEDPKKQRNKEEK